MAAILAPRSYEFFRGGRGDVDIDHAIGDGDAGAHRVLDELIAAERSAAGVDQRDEQAVLGGGEFAPLMMWATSFPPFFSTIS